MSSGRTVTLSSGHKMPQVGYGTWQAPPGEVGAGVFEALKAGYRHLDLAKVYGNQKEVGQGIKKALAEVPGLKREDIFITSKLWNNSHRPDRVAAALDDTLAELELEYLDLYLIHWPVAFAAGDKLFPNTEDNSQRLIDRNTYVSQTWKAVTELPKSKTRSVGVSNFTIEQLEGVIKATGVTPAVHQIERHPLLPDTPLIDFCAKNNIIITAYSGFGNNTINKPLLLTHESVKATAERLGATPAQVLLAWGQIGGHTIIPKSVTASRIRENFQEINLDDEAVKTLNKIGENPVRYNIPINYNPPWSVDIFGTEDEKTATYKVLVDL